MNFGLLSFDSIHTPDDKFYKKCLIGPIFPISDVMFFPVSRCKQPSDDYTAYVVIQKSGFFPDSEFLIKCLCVGLHLDSKM